MNYAQSFLMANMSSFPADKLPILQKEVEQLDDQAITTLTMTEIKNPTTALLLSIFVGELGIDRFYVGHKELGILKLSLLVISFVTLFILIGFFLLPILYIWKIVDIFLIMGACKQANFERLIQQLNYVKMSQKSQAAKTQEPVKEDAVEVVEAAPVDVIVTEHIEETSLVEEAIVTQEEAVLQEETVAQEEIVNEPVVSDEGSEERSE